MTECVALWSWGSKEAAIEKFLSFDWNDASLFPSGTALGYSESDFASLPKTQQRQLMREVEGTAKALKQMSLRVKQLGDQSRASANSAKAKICFNSVGQCGTALDQPNRLRILQLVGKGD